jgi:hypothetical protein
MPYSKVRASAKGEDEPPNTLARELATGKWSLVPYTKVLSQLMSFIVRRSGSL